MSNQPIHVGNQAIRGSGLRFYISAKFVIDCQSLIVAQHLLYKLSVFFGDHFFDATNLFKPIGVTAFEFAISLGDVLLKRLVKSLQRNVNVGLGPVERRSGDDESDRHRYHQQGESQDRKRG